MSSDGQSLCQEMHVSDAIVLQAGYFVIDKTS